MLRQYSDRRENYHADVRFAAGAKAFGPSDVDDLIAERDSELPMAIQRAASE